MMSSNTFNSRYSFADSLCYTTAVNNKHLSSSYPALGSGMFIYRDVNLKPNSGGYKKRHSSSEATHCRSYSGKSSNENRHSFSSVNSSTFGSYNGNINGYLTVDHDDEENYHSDSSSTLEGNEKMLRSPSALSESTLYSAATTTKTGSKVVSFAKEVELIEPPTMPDLLPFEEEEEEEEEVEIVVEEVEEDKKKQGYHIFKKALKIMKLSHNKKK